MCQKRANGTCPELSNSVCSDFRIIPEYDKAIWASARVAHDHYLRGSARQSDLNEIDQPAIEYHVELSAGQSLYYRNKFTGKIESGTVKQVGPIRFEFAFDNRMVKLGYSAINTRLYLTYEDARNS